MTVAELIEVLKGCPQDMKVKTMYDCGVEHDLERFQILYWNLKGRDWRNNNEPFDETYLVLAADNETQIGYMVERWGKHPGYRDSTLKHV
jgi:hypothetical protein